MQTGSHLSFEMLLSGTDGSIFSKDMTFLAVITGIRMAILH